LQRSLEQDNQTPSSGTTPLAAVRGQRTTTSRLWTPRGSAAAAATTGITPMLERSFTEVSAGIVSGSAPGRRSFGTKSTPLDGGDTKTGRKDGGKRPPVGKRRSISPDGEVAGVKRSKSVTEETAAAASKAFEEPPWE